MNEFFDNYDTVLKNYNYPASRIWNCDETGIPTVPPKPGMVIAAKGSRVEKLASAEKGTNVTACIAVSASGLHILPFFLFPRKNWRDNWTLIMLHLVPLDLQMDI